jgi:hypothetical protein
MMTNTGSSWMRPAQSGMTSFDIEARRSVQSWEIWSRIVTAAF